MKSSKDHFSNSSFKLLSDKLCSSGLKCLLQLEHYLHYWYMEAGGQAEGKCSWIDVGWEDMGRRHGLPQHCMGEQARHTSLGGCLGRRHLYVSEDNIS